MGAPVMAAAALGGAAISAYGQYKNAQSQASAYENNANNAISSISQSIFGASSASAAAAEADAAAADAQRAADYTVAIGENKFQTALVNADLARAEGQIKAFNAAREKKLALSAIQARGAASGAGPALDVAGQVGAQGEFNKLMALYEGENTARSIYDQGVADKWNAQNTAYGIMQQRRSIIAQGASYRNQATSYGNAATAAYQTAGNYYNAAAAARNQAPMMAAGTLLGGAGSALTSYKYMGGTLPS